MLETAIKEYQSYLNRLSQEKKDLFNADKSQAIKVSIQVCLHKIPNILNEKRVLCKLPHSLYDEQTMPEICLITKDVDKKSRDYEKTIRKYKSIVETHQLTSLIKHIIPLKQLNLEFRHFEAKRKLSTSFELFLADKALHEILFGGSKLGKEFRKRRRMPMPIDLEDPNLRETILNIINSTVIRISGQGVMIDINAFLSKHTVEQAMENVEAIKKCLIENLPGGEENIKSIFLKSTDQVSVPIYVSTMNDPSVIKLKNNMSEKKIKRAKKFSVLKRKLISKTKARVNDLVGGVTKNKKKLNKKQNLKLAKAINLAAVQKMANAVVANNPPKKLKDKKVEKMIE